MLIKSYSLRQRLVPYGRFLGRRRLKFLLILGCLLSALVLGVASLGLGYYWGASGFIGLKARPVMDRVLHPVRYVQALAEPVTNVSLDVAFEEWQKLNFYRQEALEKGRVVEEVKEYVKASMSWEGHKIPVKIRLKGGHIDHLENNQASFRVKVVGDHAFGGMKKFSLQSPRRRNFIYEWVYHQLCRRNGVLGLRYSFIDLRVNGKSWGIYNVEEAFSKELLESQQRREGVMVRYSENDYLYRRAVLKDPYLREGFSNSLINIVGSEKALKKPHLKKQFLRAQALLEGFRDKSLNPHEVFDADKTAAYLAVVDVTGADHAVNWHNMRFYYNPVLDRLEPIAFDGNSGRVPDHILGAYRTGHGYQYDLYEHLTTLLRDDVIFEKYIAYLEQWSRDDDWAKQFAAIQPEMNQNIRILRKTFSNFHIDPTIYQKNLHSIQSALNPEGRLTGYFQGQDESFYYFKVANKHYLPIDLLGFQLDGEHSVFLDRSVRLPEKSRLDAVDLHDIKVPKRLWGEMPMGDVKLLAKIVGHSRICAFTLLDWPFPDVAMIHADKEKSWLDQNEVPFLLDQQTKTITVISGTWMLTQPYLIPEGYRCIFPKGTTIDLKKGAYLKIFGPLETQGTEDQPVVFESSDQQGQGLFVSHGQTNQLTWTTFRHLLPVSKPQLSGAVTFYRTKVSMQHCRFEFLQCEDALNLVNSQFQLDECSFDQVMSDALDVDFGKGDLRKLIFTRIGNDALDFSGSDISISGVVVRGAGDKGLSVGEASRVRCDDTLFEDCKIGIACKDSSVLNAEAVQIHKADKGVVIFQKKPEYGPARVTFRSVDVSETLLDHLVEKGSWLFWDNEEIRGTEDRVYELLYRK